MLPPCEMMVEYFLPNIRGLVAHELHSRGESQRRIAMLLGVTQARVSHYLGNERETYSSEITRKFGSNVGEIESYSKILAEDVSRSQVDGIFTLYSIWKNLLFQGNVCAIHRTASGISSECSVCMELHRPLSKSETAIANDDALILRDISQAVSFLENSAMFPQLMPEVSVNIAMSRPDPKSMRDVAAIPGRLNKIHGRAKSFVLPEFGASNHMSNVLLIFNSKVHSVRASMNIKYDSLIDAALSALGIKRVFTSEEKAKSKILTAGHGSNFYLDPVLRRLYSVQLPDRTQSTFAVVDRGSEGVEPNTYLIGQTAGELAQAALKISHKYATAIRSSQKVPL